MVALNCQHCILFIFILVFCWGRTGGRGQCVRPVLLNPLVSKVTRLLGTSLQIQIVSTSTKLLRLPVSFRYSYLKLTPRSLQPSFFSTIFHFTATQSSSTLPPHLKWIRFISCTFKNIFPPYLHHCRSLSSCNPDLSGFL